MLIHCKTPGQGTTSNEKGLLFELKLTSGYCNIQITLISAMKK